MPGPSDPKRNTDREKLIGLGERSFKKSYYPELRKRIADLELFRSLLDQAGDGIWLIKAATGRIVDANETARKQMGRPREEVLRLRLWDYLPAQALSELEKVFGSGEAMPSFRLETEVVHRSGKRTPVELSVSLHTMDGERYAVLAARDITRRLQAREKLRRTEEKYRSIFENAVEGIFQITPEGRFLSANPSMAHILGYATPEELQEQVQDFGEQHYVDPEDRAQLLDVLYNKGFVSGYEVKVRRVDQERIWVSFSSRMVADKQGRVQYYEGFCTDITKRKEAEEGLARLTWELEGKVADRTRDLARKAAELERANERLRQQDELKSAFFSAVSHELRTPLTSVLGFAKVIERDFAKYFSKAAEHGSKLEKKSERIMNNLAIVNTEGARLTRLINDFLDLTKIESGRVEWNDRDMSVNAVMFQARDVVSGSYAQKSSVSLIVTPGKGVPPIYADPDRILQVLINLLHNALKYTPEGTVTMTACGARGTSVRITVKDTGIGVPPEDLERIFHKFHQSGRGDTMTGDAKGTGLGLTLCREIVDHYNGRIWAESVSGGTVFMVELPAIKSSS